MNNLDKLTCANEWPSLPYYNHVVRKFGGVAFGDPQVKRMSTMAVEFPDIYLDDNGQISSAMDIVVNGILKVLKIIGERVSTDEFHHVSTKNLVQGCINDWHQMGLTKLDFVEFWIVIVVQICCLIKVEITGHADLHNLVYPVASLGAAKQLVHVDHHDRPYFLSIIIYETGLEDFGTNAREGCLCKFWES
jgi:hypothetical protein